MPLLRAVLAVPKYTASPMAEVARTIASLKRLLTMCPPLRDRSRLSHSQVDLSIPGRSWGRSRGPSSRSWLLLADRQLDPEAVRALPGARLRGLLDHAAPVCGARDPLADLADAAMALPDLRLGLRQLQVQDVRHHAFRRLE